MPSHRRNTVYIASYLNPSEGKNNREGGRRPLCVLPICPERGTTALLELVFPTSSYLRVLHLVPGKSPVPTMLGQGVVVWDMDRDMVHGQKGPALHSSSFCQEHMVTSESHSEQG